MAPRFVTHLWFEHGALEAAEFYTQLFPNSRITAVTHYSEVGREFHGQEPGTVMTVSLELNGRPFMLLNGGPEFRLSPAFSILLECDTQEEIDRYWDALLENGEAQQCGWLVDRFGVSWQISAPMDEWLTTLDAAARDRVLDAMFQMTKIDLAALEAAARGEPAPAGR